MDRFKCCTSFAYCFLNGPTAAPSAAVFDAVEEEDQSNDLSDAAVSLYFTYDFASCQCLYQDRFHFKQIIIQWHQWNRKTLKCTALKQLLTKRVNNSGIHYKRP